MGFLALVFLFSRHSSESRTAKAGDGMDAGGRATQERLPDAGANIRVAVFNSGADHGTKGTRQESRVIQLFSLPLR
jgi:hypothetical protein